MRLVVSFGCGDRRQVPTEAVGGQQLRQPCPVGRTGGGRNHCRAGGVERAGRGLADAAACWACCAVVRSQVTYGATDWSIAADDGPCQVSAIDDTAAA